MKAVELPAEVEQERQSVRVRNGVEPVSIGDEGSPLAGLPDNIYGYTYSPLNESTPLFTERTYQSFEVHKLTEGIVHVLGYLTPADAAAVEGNREPVDVRLYPEPYGEATRLTEVSLERILRAKPVTRIDGNAMALTLDATA
jgi:hypothetical protein